MLLPHLEGSQSPRDQDQDRVGLAPASVNRIREIQDEAECGLSSRRPPPPPPAVASAEKLGRGPSCFAAVWILLIAPLRYGRSQL